MPISAFVISYNRAKIIEACLRSLRFADELIVLDKGSTDGTREIASKIADVVIQRPWSPTVEESRIDAVDICKHNNIVFLDDDECLSVAAAKFLNKEAQKGFYDAYQIPCKHFILGRHSSQAYYWPERQIRAFRKGGVQFTGQVHSGVILNGSTISSPHYDGEIYFSNLSHSSAWQWIDKTNRYTSQENRSTFFRDNKSDSFLEQFKDRFDYWMIERTASQGEYDQVVAALRAVYDIIDFIKRWELDNEIDGEIDFENFCQNVLDTYKIYQTDPPT